MRDAMAEDLREALPWGLLVAGFVCLGVAFLGIRALASTIRQVLTGAGVLGSFPRLSDG
jgi:hypothetical protein